MAARIELKVLANRLVVAAVCLLSLAMAATFLLDYWSTRPEEAWPIVEGKVTNRAMVATSLGGHRTRLTIQIQPNGPTVYAILSMNASADIPDVVHFQFGGNSSREVVLEEETSSLVGGLGSLFLALALAAVWPSCERHLRKKRVDAV